MANDELTREIAETADKRSRRSNKISSLALLVSLVAPGTALWIHLDSKSQDAETRLQRQVEQVEISLGNGSEVVYLTNSSKWSIKDVVMRFRYPSNKFRYVTLRSLRSCMQWEVTDSNLKAAGLPEVSSDGTYFEGLVSIEVSFRGINNQVWTVLDNGTFRPRGYWDTKFASGHPTKEFTDNSRPLKPKSYDEIDKCST
ncbi:hypothetical protein ABZ927_22980 [Streptomyces massasporeus]